MTFKKFCFEFLAKYRADHRCDFIWEALGDADFPWEGDGVYYLETEKANPKCVQCYEDLQEMYATGLTF